ncbi:NAD(P)H-hydrate dehydratase [Sphingomonas piscis]|uniref:ADP-dependent (S)-NAD(P)H-hydrate dehydratase n=1 Tax=Sphingomonas piscis TaxID=2714943 RepID=A0A6G7YQ74_9SPHN|nr:NAD(P)H-hydrate dehydratase [Sphingomonas piscis]QIK78892.1 NAD(P)H-hydrate dehydratase [Sphingomonas piscis]
MSDTVPLDRQALDTHPLPPVVDGDKETKGRILIVAGSRQVPGAALLAAQSAMRAGAGKLRIATAESIAIPIAIAMPEAYVVGLPEERDGGFARTAVDDLAAAANHSTAIVAGPGMEASEACRTIGEALLASPAQLVLDAALLHSLQPLGEAERPAERRPILLPHSGELASLLDCNEERIEADPIGCGIRAAKLYRALVLVKGSISHVVTPEGGCWTYAGGAPGLGVSGSGDTLAGIVGGLLARGADPLTALLWGVWLHGEAGAALAHKVGPIGFLAREIPGEIPALLPR